MKPMELVYFEQIRDVLYQLYKNQDITVYEFYNTLIETRKLLNLPYIDITGDFMSKEIVFIPAYNKFDNELTDTITRKKKVCVYARVSTDELDQENSYSTQISEYTKIIQENPEWEYAGIYADKGFSGTSINAREQFKQMIDDCHKGKIDLILTKSISRFSRNTVDCLNIVRELRNLRIEIFFEKENLYSSDNKIDLLLSILIYLLLLLRKKLEI